MVGSGSSTRSMTLVLAATSDLRCNGGGAGLRFRPFSLPSGSEDGRYRVDGFPFDPVGGSTTPALDDVGAAICIAVLGATVDRHQLRTEADHLVNGPTSAMGRQDSRRILERNEGQGGCLCACVALLFEDVPIGLRLDRTRQTRRGCSHHFHSLRWESHGCHSASVPVDRRHAPEPLRGFGMALRLYTIDDVCELIGRSRAAIYRQRIENRAPGNLAWQIAGGSLVFDADEIDAWIIAQRDAERAKFAARREAVA